jgi:hypothetical protein
LVFDESFFSYQKESLIKQLDELGDEIDIIDGSEPRQNDHSYF